MKRLIVAAIAVCVSFAAEAQAPQTVRLCVMTAGVCVPVSSSAPIPVVPSPGPAPETGIAPVTSSALAANQVIKASAGNLYSFVVSADSTLSAAAWWIMIYDATSAPADGAVTPLKCYAMPPGAVSASYAYPVPIYLSTGITIGVSTTGCFTKTASTHAFISGDAK